MNSDPIAGAYRFLEYAAFGRLLQTCRTTFLDYAAQCQSALVLGDGDGRFLQRLCASNQAVHVHSIELSRRMLQLQSSRVPPTAQERVRFCQCDARHGVPGSGYDLVVSHFFFDCLSQSEADALVERVVAVATPDPTWIVSEFRVPNEFWRRTRAALWVAIMYAFFRVTTGLRVRKIPDYAAALKRNGFRLIATREFSAGMISSEVWKKGPENREQKKGWRRGAESNRR